MEEDFRIYDSGGKFVKDIHALRQITELVNTHDEWFENGDAEIQTGAFTYKFNKDVKPQDIRKAWYDFMGYPPLYSRDR